MRLAQQGWHAKDVLRYKAWIQAARAAQIPWRENCKALQDMASVAGLFEKAGEQTSGSQLHLYHVAQCIRDAPRAGGGTGGLCQTWVDEQRFCLQKVDPTTSRIMLCKQPG